MTATPSGNAGNAPSKEVRPRRPANAVRSAEGRCVPFTKQGNAHAAGGFPATVHRYRALLRRSAPSALPRGVANRLGKAEPRLPAAGPSYAADDFVWLFDIVNVMRMVTLHVAIIRRHHRAAPRGA